jgi:radical SAM protein with 4Fe4S-binding SPASM domain
MKRCQRIDGILRSPRLVWNVLARGRYDFVYDQMPIAVRGMSIKKRLNLLASGVNLLVRRARAWSMPLHMQFELANFCNLRCPICPQGISAIKRKPHLFPPELLDKLFAQVGPYLLTASLWGWGEPNLHPRLGEILKIVRKHRVATFLSTNGQNLNQKSVFEAIIQNPPTFLIVAIDGLTDETNSVFRVGARLEPALEGVRRLAELKEQRQSQLPVLHMRFIAMRHNQHQVSDLNAFALKHRFDFLTVRTLSIIDCEGSDVRHETLIPEEEPLRAYRYAGGHRLEKDDFYCYQPFWFPSVFAEGTVVSCEQDYNAQLPMGTLSRETDFNNIWRSQRARKVREKVRDQPAQLSFCRSCPYRDRQTTDCSIAAFRINGSIDYDHLI